MDQNQTPMLAPRISHSRQPAGPSFLSLPKTRKRKPPLSFSTIFAHLLYLFHVTILPCTIPYTIHLYLILFLTHQKTFNKKRVVLKHPSIDDTSQILDSLQNAHSLSWRFRHNCPCLSSEFWVPSPGSWISGSSSLFPLFSFLPSGSELS